MSTAPGKSRIQAYVREVVRLAALEAMVKGETLSDFVEAAILGEIERRKGGAGSSTPAVPALPRRGRKPKM